jgi:hypothetical protein
VGNLQLNLFKQNKTSKFAPKEGDSKLDETANSTPTTDIQMRRLNYANW